MIVFCLGIHCYFVSTLICMQNPQYVKLQGSKLCIFEYLLQLRSFLCASCSTILFWLLFPLLPPLHFKPSGNDATLCIVPFLASIKNQVGTKVLAVIFIFIFSAFVAVLECRVAWVWQAFQVKCSCIWIQNSPSSVDHILITWFSKGTRGYACSECAYLSSLTAICIASFTFLPGWQCLHLAYFGYY